MTFFIPGLIVMFTNAAAAQDGADPRIGLTMDVGLASAYVWRGTNLFKDDSQMDLHALLAPSVAWSVGQTGLTLGWWSAWQLNGPNRAALVDGAVGAEQDLYASYSRSLSESVSVTGTLTSYLYPLADENVAGASLPTWVEPAIAVAWEGPVRLSLFGSYYHGVQNVYEASRNFYLNPSVFGKIPLGDDHSLDWSVGGGRKFYLDEVDDNVWDVLSGVSTTISFGAAGYVTPALRGAWTNYSALDIADEVVVFGTVNVGWGL